MAQLMINVDPALLNTLKLICPIFIISLIFSLLGNIPEPDSFKDSFFLIFKSAAYGCLAFFIFKSHIGKDKIDVLTYFTYLLSVFESAHNLFLFIAPYIAAMSGLLGIFSVRK